MLNNKNLIETVKIGGLDVAIERHKNNCWVSLTNMAKRYGKRPYAWMRQEDTKEFLSALSSIKSRSPILANGSTEIGKTITDEPKSDAWIHATKSENNKREFPDLIFTRHGGNSKEQGTWCTDYRIAIRFAMWLDPYFAILVIETFVKVVNGEFILDEDGYIQTTDGRQWVSREIYCSKLGRSTHSFSGLKAHYPHHFEFVNNQHVMSREFFIYQSKKDNFEEERISFKLPVEDKRQLALPFAEYEEIMEG